MTKSATDLMQEILFSSMLDSLAALKVASKGMPNTLLRDINSIHANSTFADLPKEVQSSITTNVRAAFTRLLKEGYAVTPAVSAADRNPRLRREPPRQGQGQRPSSHRGPNDRGAPGGRPPRGGAPGGRPPRGGAPGGGSRRGPGRGPKVGS